MRYKIFLTTAILICSSACDNPLSVEDTKELQKSLSEIDKHLQLPKDEIKKLRQIEYRVFTLDSDAQDSQLSAKLNELGAERWDCFDTVTEGTRTRFFCKRPAETPLRFIPKSLITGG